MQGPALRDPVKPGSRIAGPGHECDRHFHPLACRGRLWSNRAANPFSLPVETWMKRILVLAPNKPFLGAQIVQLPFLSELRSRDPECRITLALPFAGSSVFEEFGFHAELVTGWAESATRTLGFLGRCLAGRFSHVYSLRARSSRAGAAAFLSGARRRSGFAVPGNGPFFNERIPPRETVYLALKYLDLLNDGPRRNVSRVPDSWIWPNRSESPFRK